MLVAFWLVVLRELTFKKEAHFLANELLALGESLKSLFGISIKS